MDSVRKLSFPNGYRGTRSAASEAFLAQEVELMRTGKVSPAPAPGLGSCHLRAAQEGAGNVLLAPGEDPRFPPVSDSLDLGAQRRGGGEMAEGTTGKRNTFQTGFLLHPLQVHVGRASSLPTTLLHPALSPQLRSVHRQRWVE